MPTTTSTTASGVNVSTPGVLSRLSSADLEVKLKALRELKNQIIGNPTKKLSFLNLGAVPAVASILAEAISAAECGGDGDGDRNRNFIVQSAAVLGSFACNFEAGAKAVLDAGAFSSLFGLVTNPDEKVVDAGARSVKMIYQSKLAPKYDFIQCKNMEFLLSLLNSENEIVTGLGASIITHSCKTSVEQKVLFDAGVLTKLTSLLQGTLSQRDASLESLATILENNPEVVLKFIELEGGRALDSLYDLVKDRFPRTRLLASLCLIVIRNTSPCFLQDIPVKTKLINTVLELLGDPSEVGVDAPFAISSLIAHKEDMQKLAFEMNAIEKLCSQIQKDLLRPRHFEGILLALSDMCSQLEYCRYKFLSLEVLNVVVDALAHDSADVRSAACICLRNVSRSIKNLCAGHFMSETVIKPLMRLLDDPSTSVQVAALGVISNIVVDLTTHRSVFIKCGGVTQLVQLSKSMDAAIRLNALWALKNLVFMAESKLKEEIFVELTAPSIASLVCDAEFSVQEQALAFLRNLVDGCVESIDYIFAEDGIILNAVGRQLRRSYMKSEIITQGIYVLNNIATGEDIHKDAVMNQLLQGVETGTQSFFVKSLQSNDNRLRTAAIWLVLNLTIQTSSGASGSRLVRLRDAGIVSQVKNMVNDHCLDVKLRVGTALEQFRNPEDGST